MATANDITQLAATLAQLAQLAQTLAEQGREPTEPTAPRMPDRVLLTAEEATERLGIGRTLMFRLIRTGEIESIQIHRLRRVPTSAIDDYAARLVGSSSARNAA
jgi:excisionase family DNA binding protein